jgi:hypothetical protein
MKINYTNQYVAYLDVLGFSELVYKNDTKKLEQFFSDLKKTFNFFDGRDDKFLKISISDSIVFATEDTPESLHKLLKAIRLLQTGLASHDIWLRGAITYGEVHYDSETNIIVGKAFIDAYNLEREAVYPRVIVDPPILKHLKKTRKQFYNEFNPKQENKLRQPDLIHTYDVSDVKRLTDNDAIFISYASQGLVHTFSEIEKGIKERTYMEEVFYNIKNNLYGSQKHYSKYHWLKKYFEEVIYESLIFASQNAKPKELATLNKLYDMFHDL